MAKQFINLGDSTEKHAKRRLPLKDTNLGYRYRAYVKQQETKALSKKPADRINDLRLNTYL